MNAWVLSTLLDFRGSLRSLHEHRKQERHSSQVRSDLVRAMQREQKQQKKDIEEMQSSLTAVQERIRRMHVIVHHVIMHHVKKATIPPKP